MKTSWFFWWIVLSLMVWFREVDASGAIQTIELKWINLAILVAFFSLPFVMQFIWLIVNLNYSKNRPEFQALFLLNNFYFLACFPTIKILLILLVSIVTSPIGHVLGIDSMYSALHHTITHTQSAWGYLWYFTYIIPYILFLLILWGCLSLLKVFERQKLKTKAVKNDIQIRLKTRYNNK